MGLVCEPDGHQIFFDADHAVTDGLIMLLLGLMLLVTTFNGGDRPMSPVWVWISTAAGFAVAVFLIIQGSIFLLTHRGPF